MVELPELETLRRELEKETLGKRFKAPDIGSPKAVGRTGSKKVFQERVEGAKVKNVERRQGALVATLDSGDALVVLLGAGGRIERAAAKDAAAKGTVVTFAFTQGSGTVRVVDPGGDTEVFVASPDELGEAAPELGAGGLDPVADAVSWTEFARMLLGRSAKLKVVLTDPSAVAGIGPVYSDEILWEAGLRHDRISDSLSSQEIRRLYRALVETLHEAIKHRGTTTDEQPFADLYGKPGDYQSELKVFSREGEPCRRCRAPVQKARFQNRPLYYCAQCQV
jgi:formamidopyrimidine-DNA glycosylase